MTHEGFPDEVSPPLFGETDGDPLDEAVIGMTEVFSKADGWQLVWVYDYAKVAEVLRADLLKNGDFTGPDDIILDIDVHEHIAFNLLGADQGRGPILMTSITSDESAPE
jgi:hypothetical protein